MRLRDTSAICDYLDQLLSEHEAGDITNAAARIRVTIVKGMLDAKKIELVAASVGRQAMPVSIGNSRPASKISAAA